MLLLGSTVWPLRLKNSMAPPPKFLNLIELKLLPGLISSNQNYQARFWSNSCHEALALLPQLLMHFNVIESANTIIKTNEIIIAALKMRSIIPDYIIDEDPDEKGI